MRKWDSQLPRNESTEAPSRFADQPVRTGERPTNVAGESRRPRGRQPWGARNAQRAMAHSGECSWAAGPSGDDQADEVGHGFAWRATFEHGESGGVGSGGNGAI